MTTRTIESRLASLFALNERTWLRHANPWSVWTRNSVLPLIILAVWSRTWIGLWSLVPIAFAVLWAWVNPRLFPRPPHLQGWASQAVLGERVWMNRQSVPVPEYHRMAPHVLSGVAGLGSLLVIFGVWTYHWWATVCGALLVYAGKLWFLDRMAWLYRDMSRIHESASVPTLFPHEPVVH